MPWISFSDSNQPVSGTSENGLIKFSIRTAFARARILSALEFKSSVPPIVMAPSPSPIDVSVNSNI